VDYYPNAIELSIVHPGNLVVMAILFDNPRVPYVVKNAKFGTSGVVVKYETPWRDATGITSARHNDLIQMLDVYRKPILQFDIGNTPKHKSFQKLSPTFRTANPPGMDYDESTLVLRVRLFNRGKSDALRCVVILDEIKLLYEKRKPVGIMYYDELKLTWSNHPDYKANDLLPDAPYWLDLISTKQFTKNRFFLETNPKSNRFSDGFEFTGLYRFSLTAYAHGTSPVRQYVYVSGDGDWKNFQVVSESEWVKTEAEAEILSMR
jgi:hypothetical protein